jgi:hypothetical protein
MTTLPPRRLISQPHGSGFTYVYADPKGCNCLYVGDANDYQAYQRLAVKQRIAQQNADAAASLRLSAMNWDLWGPFDGWGWQGPYFVHYGGHFGAHGGHFGDGTGHHPGSGRHR